MRGILSGADVDFYKVHLSAGARLVVIMDDDSDRDGSYTDTALNIFDTDGLTILATGDAVGFYGGVCRIGMLTTTPLAAVALASRRRWGSAARKR